MKKVETEVAGVFACSLPGAPDVVHQLIRCKRFADRRGIVVPEDLVVIEPGPGRAERTRRKLLSLAELGRRGELHALLIADGRYVAGSPGLSRQLIGFFERLGVCVVDVGQTERAVAEAELHEQVIYGFETRIDGAVDGEGGFVPEGEAWVRVVQEEAEVICHVQSAFAAGLSVDLVAASASDLTGDQWTTANVERVLDNDAYVGRFPDGPLTVRAVGSLCIVGPRLWGLVRRRRNGDS